MEGIFGREAGRAIFFRLNTAAGIFSIFFGLVGLAASLLVCRAWKKTINGKKTLSKG
jgi:formate hydrogenlyase subunit 3/multisubunit Na+/H+ antiporter MnhD subunit